VTKRVFITGLGAITPVGNDVPTTWESLVSGKSGIGPITRFDASDLDDLMVDLQRARLWLAQGNVEAAERWLRMGPEGRERAREFEAVAVIREIKTSEAYTDALERAGRSTVGAARDVLVDPVRALRELPGGVRILAGEVKAAAGAIGEGDAGVSESVKSAIGYHTAKRRLARELGVDPYSSNATLQQELDDLAWAVYAGGATIDAAMLAAPTAVSLSVRGAKTATLPRHAGGDVSPARLYAEAEDALSDLGLTEEEGQAFWPLYREYQQSMAKVGDRMQKLILDYAKIYETATEEQAEAMLGEMLSIQNDELKTKQSYAKKFKKVIPVVKVARFYQIENKIDAIIDYDLAASIPLIGAGS